MRSIVWSLPVLLIALVPVCQGQEAPRELDFQLTLTPGTAIVGRLPGELPTTANFEFHFRDASIEQIAPPTATLRMHYVTSRVDWEGNETPPGWSYGPPVAPGLLAAGDSGIGTFEVFHSASSTQLRVTGTLTVTFESKETGETFSRTVAWAVVVAPSPSASIDVERPANEVVRPDALTTVHLSITNTDAYAAPYTVSALVFSAEGVNPADFAFGGTGSYFLQPGETRSVEVVFKAPRQLFWYNSVPLQLQFAVEGPQGSSRATANAAYTLDGFYLPPNLLFLVVAAALQAVLLVWLIVFARRQYESRYLGRPIPPWRIPQEAAFLERLKGDDPRAHYVMRYFLMEEEYRSALLWFTTYKKVNKKQLKADIKAVALREQAQQMAGLPVERHERAFERVQRRYERRIERAQRKTQKRIDVLQARLERSFEADFEKDHKKWEGKVEKLRAKHDRPYVKAKKKWDAETAKILAKWEKPFKRDQEKYEAALAKAKAAYAAKVKKADKPTWKEWRLRMEDWEIENKLRKKEGRELAAEPELFSPAVGAPELPPAFVPPSKPDLPPEPQPTALVDLPKEPTLATPDLATSHYAKDARKVEQKGLRQVRTLELELAAKLSAAQGVLGENQEKILRKRERLLAASESVAEPSFVDKVLRRTPAESERRHHIAYIRALTKERIKELYDAEETTLERVRIEGERAQVDVEAKIFAERASLSRAKAAGDAAAKATESAKLQALLRQLGELRNEHAKRLAEARRASTARIQEQTARLKAEERERLDKESKGEAHDATPTRS